MLRGGEWRAALNMTCYTVYVKDEYWTRYKSLLIFDLRPGEVLRGWESI